MLTLFHVWPPVQFPIKYHNRCALGTCKFNRFHSLLAVLLMIGFVQGSALFGCGWVRNFLGCYVPCSQITSPILVLKGSVWNLPWSGISQSCSRRTLDPHFYGCLCGSCCSSRSSRKTHSSSTQHKIVCFLGLIFSATPTAVCLALACRIFMRR
jgi:hypothetical protein